MRAKPADAAMSAMRALADPEAEKQKNEAKVIFSPENLEVFLVWMALGGTQHPPSIEEIERWPSTKRHDYMFFLATYYRLKEQYDQNRAS